MEVIYSSLTQLDKSKTPGSNKTYPSIVKDEKITQYLQILSRNASIAALYLRHGYIVPSPKLSIKGSGSRHITITIGV